ncbi:biopolymer transporter ExbD [Simkania negevensis]|uniref:Biopolymer transporter ExbD n=1 Tax=Simkania negevensis TaxID=83561 RepID=A0ABS3AR99_9BACT|nr:biopolymer transporter ExbD [Simkania negevensis]
MSRRRTRAGSNELEDPIINLTPLIDVVFVVLIMFIIIAPLLEVDQVLLANKDVGTTIPTAVQEKSPIAVRVLSDNTIKYNDQQVTPKQLSALLMQAKEEHPTRRLQLFHDKRAQFGTYQEVKNAAEGAGFEEMDVILNPR